MNNLVQKVSEYMQEQHMVEDGQKIVVGVSGGADSMGLLSVLSELAEYFHFSLVEFADKPRMETSPTWKMYAESRVYHVIVSMWI